MLQAVLKEVSDSNGKIVLFIDEIHTVVGAGATGGAMDAGMWAVLLCIFWCLSWCCLRGACIVDISEFCELLSRPVSNLLERSSAQSLV
jgi:hypothetical protein